MSWGLIIAGGSALIGTGVSMYGANKQAKDSAQTRDLNLASQNEAERQNWTRYLMTRGITPSADTQVGVVPGATPGAPINTKLPIWAKVLQPQMPMAAGPNPNVPFLIRKPG